MVQIVRKSQTVSGVLVSQMCFVNECDDVPDSNNILNYILDLGRNTKSMAFVVDNELPYLGLSMMYLVVIRTLKVSITMKQVRNSQ